MVSGLASTDEGWCTEWRPVVSSSLLTSADWTLASSGGGGDSTWMTVAPGPAAASSGPSSTDNESMSRDRESDSEPAPAGGDLDARSLAVNVLSGDGLPESTDRLSREAAGAREMTVVRWATLAADAGVWLMEWRCGNARDSGGVVVAAA